MSKHNFQMEAYRYACVKAFADRLAKNNVKYNIISSGRYQKAKVAFECEENTNDMYAAAVAAIDAIFSSETFASDESEHLSIMFNDAATGLTNADIRDIIIRSDTNGHEIGFVCSPGNYTTRHTMLSWNVGEEWFGYPSGEEYTAYIEDFKDRIMAYCGLLWDKAFKDKISEVYEPSIIALKAEIKRICDTYEDAPEKLFEHFFGHKDYYKIVMLGKSRQTKVMAYNIYGTLGNDVPVTLPPKKLIECRFKEKNTGEISKNMLTLIFDGGWVIDMRIHNSSSKITSPRLKIDIQLSGVPYGMLQEQRKWSL